MSKNKFYEIKIDRSLRRNSVSLSVSNNILFIKAPSYVSDKKIENIIENKKNWINRKLLEDGLLRKKCLVNYNNGDLFLYKGKQYELKINESIKDNVFLSEKYLYVNTSDLYPSKEIIKKNILSWYHDKSKYHIIKTANYYKVLMNISINDIKISDYKSKWGSCNKYKNLAFNWRIILAPEVVIKYLVVHELSHVTYPNHSSKFWKNVEYFMPDYQHNRNWLRKNSRYLLMQCI